MGSSVGNVTSLLYLTSFPLWFLWMVNFFLVGTFVISTELFLFQGHENTLMVFSSKFAVSCFMFKSTAYMTFVFPLCRHSFLPLRSPFFPPIFFSSSYNWGWTQGFCDGQNVPYHTVVFLAHDTSQVDFCYQYPLMLHSLGRPFPSASCQPLYPKWNPSLVCSDMSFSLPSTSVTNYLMGFPHIFKFHDNFMLIDNDL